jgi:hypothetical protein
MRPCHQCKSDWTADKRTPGVKEICPACGAYLHCCLNCRHYDAHAHNKCRIPNTDWVGDRRGPNFCDEFDFAAPGAPRDPHRTDEARQAFGELFGDEEGGEAPPDFDDLFKS